MFIFTVLLALACVACNAEDGPTGLKGAVGNEDAWPDESRRYLDGGPAPPRRKDYSR